jgi:hypothetical protein
MTTQSQNKKTVRHFQCRDYLWEIFEQMSAELECSTDYLINEAMRQYARSRNYGTNRSTGDIASGVSATGHATPSAEVSGVSSVTPTGVPIPSLRSAVEDRRASPSIPTLPNAPDYRKDQRMQRIVTAPRPPSMAQMKAPGSLPPPPPRRPSSSGGLAAGTPVPPPLPSGAPPGSVRGQRVPLYVIFGGQKIPIAKDEYVIGRSAKAADLPIKDGNISRRHAAVVFQGGAFYIKDLGSTNGIEFDGRQIDSKRIDEGDVFRLCDYEIQFTYR